MHFSNIKIDGSDPSNWYASPNLSHDSEALYNDHSENDNSSNSSNNDDTSGANSTDIEPEEKLLGDITVEDFGLLMNGLSIESHRARLAHCIDVIDHG